MNYAQIVAYVGNSYCTVPADHLKHLGGDDAVMAFFAAVQEHNEGLGLTAQAMRAASVAADRGFSPAISPAIAKNSPGTSLA